MKRKEPKQTSPVLLKKNRTSIGEVGSPAPASSVEEQKRRAKEWFDNEEKKKVEAGTVKSTAKPRSKTPTTKTPSKKEKPEVEEEPVAPRSTRKTARASETPSRNRTLSAKVEVEFIDDEEESEEEEVVAPAPKVRKTSSAKAVKEESVPVKTPRSRKAAPAKVPTPILSPEPVSPPLTKAQILEEERRRAREWYEEQERNKIASPSSSAPKSATKTAAPAAPKSATKTAAAPKSATKSATKPPRSATTTPNKAATTPVGHPATSGTPGAQCPFAAEAERQRVPETFNPNAHHSDNSASANECHQTLAVSVALAAVPLGAIAYYDPKIAVTTLMILFIVSVVRRIFAMIADAEKNI